MLGKMNGKETKEQCPKKWMLDGGDGDDDNDGGARDAKTK